MGIVASTVTYHIHRQLADKPIGAFSLPHYIAFNRLIADTKLPIDKCFDLASIHALADANDDACMYNLTFDLKAAYELGEHAGKRDCARHAVDPASAVTTNPYIGGQWGDRAAAGDVWRLWRMERAWRNGWNAAVTARSKPANQ